MQLINQSKIQLFQRAPVAQLVEHRAVVLEVVSSNTQDLKITEEKVLPL